MPISLSKKSHQVKYGRKLFRRSVISGVIAKKNPMCLFNSAMHVWSVFYQQLMQFVEVQQMLHFPSLKTEIQ